MCFAPFEFPPGRQVFGARRLNTNEDSEKMLGYDLYSSALSDILTEPTLTMPITVGLYAKYFFFQKNKIF